MAKFHPPEQFDFSSPTKWPEWRERFLRFRMATKLGKEEGSVQVSSLIYAMGADAEKIYSTFTFEAGQSRPEENFELILSKFNSYFTPKRNIIHERAKFYTCSQKEGESVEQYIRTLYELAAYCEFSDKSDSIRDRLVLGLTDREISQKLQLQRDLTLDAAVEIARHYEMVKGQLLDQRGLSTDSVRFGAPRRQTHSQSIGGKGEGSARRESTGNTFVSHKGESANFVKKCGNCGQSHYKTACPAKGKSCRHCGKLGHFISVCRQRKQHRDVHSIMHHDTVTQSYTFDSILSTVAEPPWRVTVNIHNLPINFKIDTGADVSVISRATYNKISPSPKLTHSTATLRSPGGFLQNLGEFTAPATFQNKKFQIRLFVINEETDSLLGRGVVNALGLVQKNINEIGAAVPLDLSTHIKCTPVTIKIRKDAEPYSLPTARRVPIPLIDKVMVELQRMEKAGVIEPITEATDWCAPMVPVLKKNGSIRICTDFKKLNSAVKRERYVLPVLDDILHKLQGATVFSKLDAASGFWQIPLDSSTAKLTTFITPFGRYYYKRLPFGITSAPEIFQRVMENILEKEQNVICYFDDVLVFSKTEKEHEKHLSAVLKRLNEVNLQLNQEKCEYRKKEIDFLGHRISKDGISPDPIKVSAIIDMPEPQDVEELRRLLGMVNFMGRYIPNISTILRPLTQLLEKKNHWTWGSSQINALTQVKKMLTSTPTLAFFDILRPCVVSVDASSYGIGGVLLQECDGKLKPVVFCSRTLTPAEKNYAQIEKELLAAVWTCEKLQKYLMGLPSFTLQTDHKPLISLINVRDLQDTPIRCQRMLIRLMRFNVHATYIPGVQLIIADTLSRSPQQVNVGLDKEVDRLIQDIDSHIDSVRMSWPASDAKLLQFASESEKDPIINTAIKYTENGWPKYVKNIEQYLKDFYNVRFELSVHQGMLIRGSQIVVPRSLRAEILSRIHDGHLGITKCRERAKQSVWWPGISGEIQQLVSSCQHCEQKMPTFRREPIMSTPLPSRPFQMIGADICDFKGQNYLVVVDYYSRYLEILPLSSMTSVVVITKFKSIFAHHGIPESLVTDNGRQFTSREFQTFSEEWNFLHVTSSPYYAQSNGEAERAVQEAKKILSQADFFLALMNYRSSPTTATGYSPAELVMGRKIRTILPTLPVNLSPKIIERKSILGKDEGRKRANQIYYNRRHGTRKLPPLEPGTKVLQKLDHERQWTNPATVIRSVAPRSYLIKTSFGTLRRNRKHLRPTSTFVSTPTSTLPDRDDVIVTEQQNVVPQTQGDTENHLEPQEQAHGPPVGPTVLTTRSGRVVNPPARYRND